jgi:exodeoxyribonuclease VII small subunit
MEQNTPVTLNDFLDEADPAAIAADLTFEKALELLNELVIRVESGGLPLDRAVLSYERGAFLIEHLRAVLAGAETKLVEMKKIDGKIVSA